MILACHALGYALWSTPITAEVIVLLASVIRHLPGNIAVLDAQGVIRAVNVNWTNFALANGIHHIEDVGPGTNYLAVCQQSAAAGDAFAGEIERQLRRLLSGEFPLYSCEYPCHSEGIQRWFDLRASALTGAGGVVVCHTNITVGWRARKLLAQPAAEAQPAPLVTMCSGCKRIQDTPNHWQPIEDWLFERHQYRFSHGLCLECIERLYPGLIEP